MFRQHTFPQSTLHDQDSFYPAFIRDITHAKSQLVIESPFITSKRVRALLPTFEKLCRRGVTILINTRNPEKHDSAYQRQAADAIETFQSLGIVVLYTTHHHRKLAIIDNEIVWEGSLNILSFNDSCEIMRRIASPEDAKATMKFIGIEKYARCKY
jgi:phosphatidylserine/phosphatidylglycerophosphate/cardiolipin synthase-like enzyme